MRPGQCVKACWMMHDMTQPTGSRHSESDVGRFKRKPMQQAPASQDDASKLKAKVKCTYR